ncbi:MAG: hypothetical protein HY266_05120 [Deltaproteobacteria bacterium]|nr:hypothetical protein [Deltaproteobacteria bacterium]
MSTAKKMLFVLDEEIKKDLNDLIPAGQRSRVINEALRKEILFLKRKKATEELLQISSRTRPASVKEIVAELRKERRH